MTIATINPSTGERVRSFAELDDATLAAKLARAQQAFVRHRQTPLAWRAERLQHAARILDEDRDRLGRIMTLEMGKPLAAAIAEIQKCALACRHYAEHGAAMLADQPLESSGSAAYLRYLPMGPVLAIMPWNFPFWQVIRFAAPALMAGNVGLLKHASNVPQCALALEELFVRAGFEHGEFQTLLIGVAQTARVLDDPRVVAVTLTGSDAAGVQIGGQAGHALKKSVLELGGSDPFIVMPSADVELAAKTAVTARTINNGQSCIAAKRFLVHAEVYAEFERRFVAGMAALQVGDPLREDTQVGPLATERGLEQLADQVTRAVAAGARVLTGGKRLPGPGYYYTPTVLAELAEHSPVYHEEVFGPVALLFKVQDLDQAIAMANDSPFGLGSSVWTNDELERIRFVDELQVGQTFVNAMVVSDPRLPFGGVKRSGYGRELGTLGIREFVNIKTVYVA